MKVPKKVQDRFVATIKGFQQVAESHKKRDVSEADTVTLVKDILADVFGFNKYNELTSEQMIKGTFCDLAVKIDGKIKYLIEVKSAGIELNTNQHLRQAQLYGANEGIEWLVLTNSVEWKLYRLKFTQPIAIEEVCTFNLLALNLKNDEDLAKLFLFCREGITTDAMSTFHGHIALLNKFTIAQVIQSEAVISSVRKEMRRLFPELKVESEKIVSIIATEVLKREVIEGDKVKEAQDRIKKIERKYERDQSKKALAETAKIVELPAEPLIEGAAPSEAMVDTDTSLSDN